MSLVKICGLTRPEDIEAANEAGPTYIGFVFAPSRRRVTPETAARLRAGLRADIRVVGVFVDAPPGEPEALLQRGIIDIVQLHREGNRGGYPGAQGAHRARRLSRRCAWRRRGTPPDGGTRRPTGCCWTTARAGTGRAFDWTLAAGVSKPFFLAGGIHPGNAADAVRRLRPYAVDASSGVETNGYKDGEKDARAGAGRPRSERRGPRRAYRIKETNKR